MHDIVTLRRLAKAVHNLDLNKVSSGTCLDALLRLGHNFITLGPVPDTRDLWIRARICEGVDKYDCLSQVLCNKLGNPGLGRCNLPGHNVLYLASNIKTAVIEVKATKGQLVQVTATRPLEGSLFAGTLFGAYCDIEESNNLPLFPGIAEALRDYKRRNPRAFKQALFIDGIFSKLFRNNSRAQYLLTAALSDYYLSRTGGGIFYPSVQNKSGQNLAIRSSTFDSKFEVVMSWVYQIDDIMPNGDFAYTLKHFADDYGPDGQILWHKPPRRMITRPPYMHEVPRTPGWRPLPASAYSDLAHFAAAPR